MGEEQASFYTGKGYLKKGVFEHYKPLYQEIANLLPPPNKCSKIIDLGCGIGYFAKVINDLGYKKYLGIDFSDTVLQHARENVKEFGYVMCNLNSSKARKIFSRNKIFTAVESLEHIQNDLTILKGLPKNSCVIGSVPNSICAGHVRSFKGIEDVVKRYGSIINFDFIKTFLMMKRKNRMVIIFRGTIK